MIRNLSVNWSVFPGAIWRVVVLLCLLLQGVNLWAQSSGPGERRVALVVGNSSYKGSPLKNPENDARDVANALRKLNFDVIERENLGREAFSKAVREFGDRLKGANVALFYFAGHGLQVKGRNYLVPVDADIAREDEVPYRSLDVNEVLDKMDSARTGINLVVLDACRNNPFARSFKLSQVGLAQMDAPQGTLISFATAPGSVAQDGEGANGLFTGSLLKHIGAPGLAVEQMFKRVRVDVVRASNNSQVPWESSSLNRDFAFAMAATAAVSSAASPSPTNNGSTSELALELAFWEAVRGSRNPADYRAYLEQYPQGRFASLARVRVQAPPVSEAAAVSQTVPVNVPTSASEMAMPGPSLGAGAILRGSADGRVSYRLTSALGERSVDLGTSAPVSELLVSPEGLYAVAVSNRTLYWLDLERASILRRSTWKGDAQTSLLSLAFSANGRWLLLKTLREGRPSHQLVDVGSGQVVWDKTSVTASFDVQRPAIHLQDASGQTTLLDLPV